MKMAACVDYYFVVRFDTNNLSLKKLTHWLIRALSGNSLSNINTDTTTLRDDMSGLTY